MKPLILLGAGYDKDTGIVTIEYDSLEKAIMRAYEDGYEDGKEAANNSWWKYGPVVPTITGTGSNPVFDSTTATHPQAVDAIMTSCDSSAPRTIKIPGGADNRP